MNLRISRPGTVLSPILFPFLVLISVGWFFNTVKAGGTPITPTDHIDPDDVLIWKSLSNYLTNDFAIDPIDNSNIYIATDYPTGIAFSKDFGTTWITRSVGANSFENGLAVAVDPISPNYVYVGVTEDRIYRSQNGGDSWVRVDGGISGGKRVSELFVHPVTPTIVFGGSWSGIPTIFRTENRGDSWSAIPLVPGPTNREVTQIFADGTIPGRIYAVTSDRKVLISEDAGLTWPESSISAVALAVASDDPNLMYKMDLDCKAYRSTNGGATWTSLPEAEPVCYTGIFLDPLESDIVYLTSQYRAVARSLDSGQTWQILNGQFINGPYPWAFAIDPFDPTRLYVGQGVYVSILFDNSSLIPVMIK